VNYRRKAVLTFLFLAAAALVGQQNTGAQQQEQRVAASPRPTRFLLRVARLDVLNGNEHIQCILLLPDGHYRREHSVSKDAEIFYSNTPVPKRFAYETHVFEGQLSPEEIAAVNEIISRPDFRAIQTPDRLHVSRDFFETLVLREGQPKHHFLLGEATDYKPNKRALKPMFGWMSQMTKRKHDVSKKDGDACRVPEQVQWSDGERERTPPGPESETKPH
jgi:hypothetical protein